MRDLAFPGCSVAYLSQIERGKRTPSLQVVVELARKLGIDPQYLAKGESNGEPPRQAMSPLRIYRRALASARTPDEQVWVLAGLAQAAAVEGNLNLARNALEQALDLLPPRESPVLVCQR